jgi:hypothetical protein
VVRLATRPGAKDNLPPSVPDRREEACRKVERVHKGHVLQPEVVAQHG